MISKIVGFDTSGDIPDFTHDGYLPPHLGDPTNLLDCAPYEVSMYQLVKRLSFTAKRREILAGFCRLRRIYYMAGIRTGFQWVNGGFSEKHTYDPKDIDIITFFNNPYPDHDILHEVLSTYGLYYNNHDKTKDEFLCDIYHVDMNVVSGRYLVERTSYWHGLFSHTRESVWKGMLQVQLPKTTRDVIHDYIAVKYASDSHE